MGAARHSGCAASARRRGRFFGAALVALGPVGSTLVLNAGPASAAASMDTDQCANGAPIDTANCNTDASDWQNGNLNSQNSTYREGESVPYRAKFTELTVGASYFIEVKYDTT